MMPESELLETLEDETCDLLEIRRLREYQLDLVPMRSTRARRAVRWLFAGGRNTAWARS